MRFSVQLPTERVDAPDEFLRGDAVAEMARAAEAAGFHACFVTDHPIPGDRWLRRGGHHTLDPFVALSFAAAATERIHLQTHVLVLPYRNPFLTAKAAASLDRLSGGRLLLGVAVGYLESEFAALGVDFEERNELCDEAIAVIRRTWTEQSIAVEGRHFRAEGNTALPHPAQQPHPPIWVGGNSRRAIRRAVELAEGWLPFPAPPTLAGVIRTAAITDLASLRDRVSFAREHAAKVGRERPLDIGFAPFRLEVFEEDGSLPAELPDEVASLEAAGVTWMMINVPCRSRADYLERVAAAGHVLGLGS